MTPESSPPQRTSLALPIVAVVAIVAVAVLLYPVVFDGVRARPTRTRLDAPRPSLVQSIADDAGLMPPPRFSISALAGPVDVRHEGEWRPAHAGQILSEDDELRTGEGGSAVLASEDGNELVLRPKVELKLRVTRTVVEVALARGRVRAQGARPGRLRFEIAAGAARALGGDTPDERFNVFAGEGGLVAVATERGEVRVVAEGKEVRVAAGRQTQVTPGQPPTDPIAIPPELLLSVAWPARSARTRNVEVSGEVLPGSEVRVNGQPTLVGVDGRFAKQIGLAPGENRISVEAEDLTGRTRAVTSPPIRLAPGGPPLDVDPSTIWKQP